MIIPIDGPVFVKMNLFLRDIDKINDKEMVSVESVKHIGSLNNMFSFQYRFRLREMSQLLFILLTIYHVIMIWFTRINTLCTSIRTT